MSKLRRKSVIAGTALLAVGAVLGAWVTAKTGQVPAPVQVSAADIAGSISLKDGFGPIVKKVQPAVVSVHSKQTVKISQSQGAPDSPLFRQFFGDQFGQQFEIPQQQVRQGLGSGVITSADGYILTNNHVVDSADEVKVTLQDGRDFDAKIVGTDKQADIAVLKINASGLPVAELGDSSKVEVGQVVLAMGNPFGVGQTVTMGIVGATGRHGLGIEQYEDFIQTDAAINPGNSGGALVNMNGELIGINTAIVSGGNSMLGGTGGNQGVGFAIPVNMARNMMTQIIDHGKVTRGWLGVVVQPVSPEIAKQFNLPGEARGALLGDVNAGSPADKAGLKRGDIVVAMNGEKVKDSLDLSLSVANMKPGSTAHLQVYRDGKEQQTAVTLGTRPGEEELAGSGSGPSSSSGALQLGIEVQPVTPQLARELNVPSGTSGLAVTNVAQGSAAAEAGLQVGDVIQEVNRLAVHDAEQFRQMVRGAKGPLLLLVRSGGNTHFVTVEPR